MTAAVLILKCNIFNNNYSCRSSLVYILYIHCLSFSAVRIFFGFQPAPARNPLADVRKFISDFENDYGHQHPPFLQCTYGEVRTKFTHVQFTYWFVVNCRRRERTSKSEGRIKRAKDWSFHFLGVGASQAGFTLPVGLSSLFWAPGHSTVLQRSALQHTNDRVYAATVLSSLGSRCRQRRRNTSFVCAAWEPLSLPCPCDVQRV